MIKISDFDLIRVSSTNGSTKLGFTVRYAAPEAINPIEYGLEGSSTGKILADPRLLKLDIYSLGYLIYYLWERKPPCEDMDEDKLARILLKEKLKEPLMNPTGPFRELMMKCWNPVLEDRPTIDEVLIMNEEIEAAEKT